MAKIIVESWGKIQVVRTKSLVFDTEELRQNFVEFENMSNSDIRRYIEDHDAIIGGEHLSESLLHEQEEERDDIIDTIETGTTVIGYEKI